MTHGLKFTFMPQSYPVNFHREVSLTLLYFFHFSQQNHWPSSAILLQFFWIILSKNRIHFETNCCKTSNILQQFFCTQNWKELKKWQTENAPIRCNFTSMMRSSISLMRSSNYPTWKASPLSYESSFCMAMSMTWITVI